MRNSLSRKTVVGVLAFFLAISVGYAIFSETITIEGTATAKGNFDVEVSSCYPGFLSDIDTDYFSVINELGYENDSCEISSDKNKATFKVDFLYPGAARHFTVKLTNVGDIDAMINLSLIDGLNNYNRTETTCYDGRHGEKNGIIDEEECESNQASVIFRNGFHGTVAIEEADGNFIYMTDDNRESVVGKYMIFKDDVVYVNVPPKGSIYLLYSIRVKDIPEYYSAVSGNKLLAKGTFTYTYDFLQSTK